MIFNHEKVYRLSAYKINGQKRAEMDSAPTGVLFISGFSADVEWVAVSIISSILILLKKYKIQRETCPSFDKTVVSPMPIVLKEKILYVMQCSMKIHRLVLYLFVVHCAKEKPGLTGRRQPPSGLAVYKVL